MSTWYRGVAAALAAPALTDVTADMEIAFGRARSALLYVLELGRAYRLNASGNLAGDDIWLQLGQARVRFTLNRRQEVVVVRSLREELRLAWSKPTRALLDGGGTPRDLETIAQQAIDELVEDWHAHPASKPEAAPLREFEDEPTKG